MRSVGGHAAQLAPDCVNPSTVTACVMRGSPVRSTMVRTPVPLIAKAIVSGVALLPAAHSPLVEPLAVLVLAAVIASGRVHNPSVALMVSATLLTVMVASRQSSATTASRNVLLLGVRVQVGAAAVSAAGGENGAASATPKAAVAGLDGAASATRGATVAA